MISSISFRRITFKDFERLHSDTAYAEAYFGLDIDADNDEVLTAYFEALEASDRYLDLDKKWKDIHFLLTGELPDAQATSLDSPCHKVCMGGAETQLDPLTYGIVRYLTINEVEEIDQALSTIVVDNLQFRLANLLERDEHREFMKSLLFNLCIRLIKFFKEATQQGDIVLLSVTV